jgi:flotillin
MSETDIILPLLAIVIPIVIVLLAVKSSYTVVPPNEAHVVVTRSKGRRIYCTREGTGYSGSSYWRIPIIQQISKIPLENLQIKVDNIPLRDMNMAKFAGDVVAWLNITDPLQASERVSTKVSLTEVDSDVSNVIKAVTRNMSMGYTIIDIMKKRKEFSESVEKAVNEELGEWGMKVIELEVIHFSDIEGYTVIHDLEERQSSIINAETRKAVAGQEKEATIVESTAKKESEVNKATNERAYREAQIATQEAIGIKEQEKDKAVQLKAKEKDLQVQEATARANAKQIEAERALTVGQAEIDRQATITKAEGEASATYQKGQAEAKVKQVQGEANAAVVQATGFAEAAATEKRADAMKKYNDAGMGLEVIKATVEIKKVQANAWAEAMKQAQIKVYSGADSGILNPQTGFGAGTMSEVAKDMGLDINKILENIGKNTSPILNATDTVEKLATAAPSVTKKPKAETKGSNTGYDSDIV